MLWQSSPYFKFCPHFLYFIRVKLIEFSGQIWNFNHCNPYCQIIFLIFIYKNSEIMCILKSSNCLIIVCKKQRIFALNFTIILACYNQTILSIRTIIYYIKNCDKICVPPFIRKKMMIYLITFLCLPGIQCSSIKILSSCVHSIQKVTNFQTF